MGLLDGFLKSKKEQEDQLINFLYAKSDELSSDQLTELIRYAFLSYGDMGAMGFPLVRFLVQRISRKIGTEFTPKNKQELDVWMNEVFSKVSAEEKKAIFVTLVFDIFQHSVFSGSEIMLKIDEMISDLKKMPNFQNLGEKEV